MGESNENIASVRKLLKKVKASRRATVAIVVVAYLLSGGLLGLVAVRAEATVAWTGDAGDGYWHTPGNWNPTRVPNEGDFVSISSGSVVECIYDTNRVTIKCAGTLTVSEGALLRLTGDCALTGGAIGGNGAIEISGTGSKLAWTEGTIGQNLDTGSLIVEAGAEFLIKKAGKATLNLFVENRGHMSISKGVTEVLMTKGYTRTTRGTLTLEVGSDGADTVILGPVTIKQNSSPSIFTVLKSNLD